MQTQQRSRLMRLSWQIQRRRHSTRSKALFSAWAIFLNEDITVYHLVEKHSHTHYPKKAKPQSLTLFTY
jgi:hypothetical protein